MIRGLATVALGGAVLSVLCIGVSGALAPHHWKVPGLHFDVSDEDNDGPSVRLTGHEATISRDLAWSGGEKLTFAAPAQITYTQGPTAKITVTGPDALVNHVTLVGDTIKLDARVHDMDLDHGLTITVTAPNLSAFDLEAAQDLTIQSIDVDALRLTIEGAGKIVAHGKTRDLHMEIDGAGDADLGGLATTDAHVEINGLGHVTTAPTGEAHLEINGAGNIKLMTHPAHVSQEINGAGSIDQPEGSGQNL